MKKLVLCTLVVVVFFTSSCSSDDDGGGTVSTPLGGCQICTSDFWVSEYCLKEDGTIVEVLEDREVGVRIGGSFTKFIADIEATGFTCVAK